jgi:hypothetical protein
MLCRAATLAVVGALAAGAQTPVPVGRISVADFRVRGQVEFAGDGSALLLSGAEVEVRGGAAALSLAGGQARFCGPLKVVVLKSAAPSAEGQAPEDLPLLFALFSSDSGAIELDYAGAASHTIQTPFFSVATLPLAEPAARKASVRVAVTGELCVAALTGSLRVREQLGTSDLLIPPGKAMSIPESGVDKAAPVEPARCGCNAGTGAGRGVPQAAQLQGHSETSAEKKPPDETKTTIATAPLVYQAEPRSAQPSAGPGKEPEVTIPVVTPGPQPAAAAAQPAPPAPAPKPAQPSSFGSKLKRLFRFLFG